MKMLCCFKFFSKTQPLDRTQLLNHATDMENNPYILATSLKDRPLMQQLNNEGVLIHIARYNVENAKAILNWSNDNNHAILSNDDVKKIEKHIQGCEAYEKSQPYKITIWCD